MVGYEYAKALFDLAIEEKKENIYLDYLNIVLSSTKEEPDFLKLINSPLIETNEKINIINKIYKSLDGIYLNFLKVLIINEKFSMLEQIKEEYNKLLSEHNNILNIEIISSEKLNADKNNQIVELLKTRYPNKKLILRNTVNSDILYGIQILCNGQIIDISLKNMLNKLKESI